jgi:hypothetical protein
VLRATALLLPASKPYVAVPPGKGNGSPVNLLFSRFKHLLVIRIYPTIIDKINWLFVQVNKKMDNTSIALMSLSGNTLYEQKTGNFQPGQMISFPLETEDLDPGTYFIQLFSNNEMVYKKKILVQ